MNFLFKGHNTILFSILITNNFFCLYKEKNKPNHRVYKFKLILMKFPILQIVWTEGKNLSLPALLSHLLTTIKQDEHRLRAFEIPDSTKIFMTHN